MLLNDTKQKVINILNASNLPIDAIYYVMKEVMADVEITYNRALQEEIEVKANAERLTAKEETETLNEKVIEEVENKEEKK